MLIVSATITQSPTFVVLLWFVEPTTLQLFPNFSAILPDQTTYINTHRKLIVSANEGHLDGLSHLRNRLHSYLCERVLKLLSLECAQVIRTFQCTFCADLFALLVRLLLFACLLDSSAEQPPREWISFNTPSTCRYTNAACIYFFFGFLCCCAIWLFHLHLLSLYAYFCSYTFYYSFWFWFWIWISVALFSQDFCFCLLVVLVVAFYVLLMGSCSWGELKICSTISRFASWTVNDYVECQQLPSYCA